MVEAPNDVRYKNNINIPGLISIHYFPKEVAVWPKWSRFDLRHRGNFTLQWRLPHVLTGFEDGCYENMPQVKSGEDGQRIQLKRMLIKGPVPTRHTIVQHSFRLTFRKRRMVSSLLFISRAWDVLILHLFPLEYICAFLIAWKSYRFQFPSYFNNRNTSFVIKFKPFPELTDILLCEQCETSSGYWHKHQLEGAVYSPKPRFPKYIPRAINSPLPSRNQR